MSGRVAPLMCTPESPNNVEMEKLLVTEKTSGWNSLSYQESESAFTLADQYMQFISVAKSERLLVSQGALC